MGNLSRHHFMSGYMLLLTELTFYFVLMKRSFRGRNIFSDLTAIVHFLVGHSNGNTRKWEHTSTLDTDA